MKKAHDTLAGRIAGLISHLPQVEAIALAGSQTSLTVDADSDIDLYVYTRAEIPLSDRRTIVEQAEGASRASLGLNFWGPGDEWLDAASGIELDLVYFDTAWMEDQLRRVQVDHQASLGYSTCFWYTVQHSQILYDPNGWFTNLQDAGKVEYPEPLRASIIALNHPVLREIIPSYAYQIKKAVLRGDLVSINHRLAALLASYFDIIFAFNRQLHPGEKRLVERAHGCCSRLPEYMAVDITRLLSSASSSEPACLEYLNILLNRLDALLVEDGFL